MSHESRSARSVIWGESVVPWIYFLRGEPVLETLSSLERTQWLSPDELAALQDRKLESLLRHCARNVPFYRERFERAGVQVRGATPRDVLLQVPILEKADVRELASQVRSTLPRSAGINVRSTAGTGGEPVIVYADADANAHSLAARLRCAGWLGIKLGAREARFWGRALDRRERAVEWVKDTLLNRLRLGPEDLHSDAIDASIRRLVRARPDYLYGYAGMILEFADRLSAVIPDGSLDLKAAILTAEGTRSAERNRLAGLLGCQVADEYGCSEIEIIAHQCGEGSYHIIAENVLVEIIPDDLSQPRRGEVIVTDLNNRLMPLLRYRLGDFAVQREGTCPCGRGLPLLEALAGRSKDQYLVVANGRRVHAYCFDYLYEQLMDGGIVLKQVQVVQESEREVVLSFVLAHDSSEARREIRRQIERTVAPLVGPETVLRERYVERIEVPRGRKYEYFIPLRLAR